MTVHENAIPIETPCGRTPFKILQIKRLFLPAHQVTVHCRVAHVAASARAARGGLWLGAGLLRSEPSCNTVSNPKGPKYCYGGYFPKS